MLYLPSLWRYDGYDYRYVDGDSEDECLSYADMLVEGFGHYKRLTDVELFLENTCEFMNTSFWLELEKPYNQFIRDIHKSPPVFSRQDEKLPPS